MLIIWRKNYHIKYRQRSRTRKSRFQFQNQVADGSEQLCRFLLLTITSVAALKPNRMRNDFRFFFSFYSRLFVVKNVHKNSHTCTSLVRLFIEISLKICYTTWYWSFYFLPFHLPFVFVLRFHLFGLNYWKVPCDIFKCELNKQRKKSPTI